MKIDAISPPREFQLQSSGGPIIMRDCARIELEPDEQVTFASGDGREYDVAKKSWGYYATPSLNSRLKRFGLRPALMRSRAGRFYVWLVETGKEADCEAYMRMEQMDMVCWLDDETTLEVIVRSLAPRA